MSELFHINTSDPTPIYAQLERAIRMAIASVRLKPGDQLPTVRQLAVDLRINANTVAKVYAELERAGVLETRRGVGTFVSEGPHERATRRDREKELRALGDRFLTEAMHLGFTFDEIITYLEQRRTQGERRNG
jgi:GntR family transcriptional regulator